MSETAIFDQKGQALELAATDQVGLGITYRTETITPERAKQLIATQEREPTLDLAAREIYASTMKAGGWVENGQPIVLDRDGRLLDGYHRLLACISAETPFRTLVAYGAKADTLHTMDQHRRRTFTGVLEARGIPHAGDVHRSLAKLIRIDNGALLKGEMPIGWSRLDLVLESNPQILEASRIAHEMPKQCLIPPKTRTPFIFMAMKSGHGDRLQQFLTDMLDVDLPASNPGRMLQINIQSIIENTVLRQIDPDVGMALAIKAFNDFIEGVTNAPIYSWKPNYGAKTKLDAAGRPLSMREVRKNAPENCGFPSMIGYPGLDNGKIESLKVERQVFSGQTAEMLRRAAKGDTSINVVTVEITPEVAAEWLAKYNSVNRKIQKSHIAKIARDIKNGNWMANAQPIAFHGNPLANEGDTPRLINGQHRLQGCIKAGIPIEVAIAVNVPEEAFATYDVHAKRMKTQQTADDRVIHAAAILQWREDMKLPPRHRDRPTATEIMQTIENHPGMVEFAAQIRRKDGKGRPDEIATGGVLVYFLYRIHRENLALAEQFFDGLRSGAELEPDNPILNLRRTATAHRKGATRLNRYDALNLLIRGWEHFKKWKKKKADQARQENLL